MKASNIIKVASLLSALAVIFGAFAAHALKTKIDALSLQTWETACRYQFYHSLAIFAIGILLINHDSKWFKRAVTFFIVGIIFFSGSLYLLSLKELLSVNLSLLGPITPLGGLCLISGWICIFLGGSIISDKS